MDFGLRLVLLLHPALESSLDAVAPLTSSKSASIFCFGSRSSWLQRWFGVFELGFYLVVQSRGVEGAVAMFVCVNCSWVPPALVLARHG